MKRAFIIGALFLSFGLCLAINIGVMPTVAGADSGNEIFSMRDRCGKTFLLPDGSRQAVLSVGSLHYKNETGNWEDIDLAISKSNDAKLPFENKTNNLKSKFPNDAKSGGIVLISEKGEIKIFGEPEIVFIAENDAVSIVENGNGAIGEVAGNSISYKLFGNAFLEFSVLPDVVKSNLVLNSLPESFKDKKGSFGFSEIISLPADWKIADGEGKIQTKKISFSGLTILNEKGKPVFIFPAPTVFEKENPAQSIGSRKNKDGEKASYSVEKLGDKYRVITRVPLSWLNAPERHFPVVIDPTATLYADYTNSTGFIEGFPYDGTYNYFGYLGGYNSETRCGSLSMEEIGWYAVERGWTEFNTSSISTGATVTNTELHYKCRTYTEIGGPAYYMNLYKMNVRPSTSGALAIYNNIGSLLPAYATSIYVAYTNYWHTSTLGSTANTDVHDGSGWFAVGFREQDESGYDWDEGCFYGHPSADRPYLVVTYTAGGTPGSWIGVTSTAWNTGSNWGDGLVPTSSVDVTIPDAATTPFDPYFSATAVCRNITVQTSGALYGGTGTLTVSGNWVNNGAFNRGASSTVVFAGASDPQTIGGTSASDFYYLNNNKTGGKLTLLRNIGVAQMLNMLSGSGTHTVDPGVVGSGYKIDFTP